MNYFSILQTTTSAFFLSLLAISCSTSGSSTEGTSQEQTHRESYVAESENKALTVAAGQQVQAYKYAETEFKKNSAILTKASTRALKGLVDEAKATDKLDQIVVLSWADREYPSAKTESLTDAEVRLAQRRADSISKYIKSLQSVDVDTHNMSERPSLVSQWVNTQDSRLKNSLIAAGLPTSDDSLKYPSKASKSIVFAVIK